MTVIAESECVSVGKAGAMSNQSKPVDKSKHPYLNSSHDEYLNRGNFVALSIDGQTLAVRKRHEYRLPVTLTTNVRATTSPMACYAPIPESREFLTRGLVLLRDRFTADLEETRR